MPTQSKRKLAETPPLHPHGDLAAWGVTVVFAPHPDDESLGCGGLIALLRRREQEVHVVFVSDGAMSHPNSQEYSYPDRVELRREEARIACAHLGVEDTHLHFLDYPDGRVPQPDTPEFSNAASRIASLISDLSATTLVVPWERDLHADHRATWALCRAANHSRPDLLRWIMYPIWMWNAQSTDDLPHPDEVIAWRIDISEVLESKKKAIRSHRSQLGQVIHDDPSGFSLWEEMLDHFQRPTELYFEEPTKREISLSEDYFAKIYSDDPDPWKFATSNYEKEKYARSLEALPPGRFASAFEIGCSIGVLTAQLATRCDRLLAVDIDETALTLARERLGGNPSVVFRKMAVPREFLEEQFDLIVVSEVGYYWSTDDLKLAISRITEALRSGGVLLLVHYTPYVPDYPLTGDAVHRAFAEELADNFNHREQVLAQRYRIDVWQRERTAADR